MKIVSSFILTGSHWAYSVLIIFWQVFLKSGPCWCRYLLFTLDKLKNDLEFRRNFVSSYILTSFHLELRKVFRVMTLLMSCVRNTSVYTQGLFLLSQFQAYNCSSSFCGILSWSWGPRLHQSECNTSVLRDNL